MVDPQIVCCMCGDEGFSDKLFRCSKCRNRFQNSYCSNIYREKAEAIEVCDWRKRIQRRGNLQLENEPRQPNSDDKTKRQGGKAHYPRQITTSRYKLLEDVMS